MNDTDPDEYTGQEGPDQEDERIEALIRLTGPRPAVPPDRAARVRTAVQAHWQGEVGRFSRRRRLWAATASLAAASILVAIALVVVRGRAGLPSAGKPFGTVEMVVSTVWMTPAPDGTASRTLVRPGDPVSAGSELATERNGRIAVRLESGHSLRLDAGTHLRVLGDRTLALDRGTVYVDSGRDGKLTGESVDIRTPLGRIRDIGTQFEVMVGNASLRVRVREGVVSLDRGGGVVAVRAGHELELDGEGRTHDRALDAYDSGWGWTEDLSSMKIEGRSLHEFLDWIARERGLRLEFASPDLAGSAAQIILNGSIQGMTLNQALESVLATCGMRHRIERNVLIVEPLGGRAGST